MESAAQLNIIQSCAKGNNISLFLHTNKDNLIKNLLKKNV